VDISGKKFLGKAYGEWTVRAALSYTHGRTTDGDNLYNIMPLNARLAIDHTLGSWSNTLEGVFVRTKSNVSAVRAEQATPGYAIANYRTSYKLSNSVRLDAGIDNLFDRQYDLPLGGLEYATGSGTKAAQPLRAMGRSINIGVSISF